MPERLAYTYAQAAEQIGGISAKQIERATRATEASEIGCPILPSRRLGRRVLIDADDLREWVKSLPIG